MNRCHHGRRHLFLLVALVATAHLPLLGQTCGGQERWPVKVGSDSRAAEVDVAHPNPISLHDLVNITRPHIPSGDDNRVDAETKVYRCPSRKVPV
jgi:hypothetical protein